jgi:hypothetical protein
MADSQGRPDDGDGATPPSRKAPAKKAPAKKAPVKRAPAKKAPAETAAKKAPAKAPAKKTPAKKAPAKKAAATKAPATKAPAKKATPHPIPVPPPERSVRPTQEPGHRIPFSIGLAAAGLVAVVLSRFRRG